MPHHQNSNSMRISSPSSDDENNNEDSVKARKRRTYDDSEAFSALEHRVQTLQPTLPTSSTTALVDDEEEDNHQDEINQNQKQKQKQNSNSNNETQNRKKAPVVRFITPRESETTFYSAEDTNIILTAENDDDATMILGNDDDDDVEFIVHDELESRTPSAVAAALELHEKRSRGIATFSNSANKKKSKRKNGRNKNRDNSLQTADRDSESRGGETDDSDDFADDQDQMNEDQDDESSSSSPSSSNNNSTGKKTSKRRSSKQKNWIQKRMSQLMPKGGLVSSAANVSAATLGSSALIIAYCFQRSAILPGALVLICNMGFTIYTIWLLMRMLDRLGEESYEGVANRICGKKFGKSAALCVAFFGWGCAAVYAAVLKSVLAPFVPYVLPEGDGVFTGLSTPVKEQIFAAAVGLVTQVPLALKEEMNSLRFVSTIGTFSIIVLVVSVVHHAIKEDSNVTAARIESRVTTPLGFSEMFQTLGIFVFSYCCQTNTFPIYEEMANRSAYRMCLASVLALTVCTLFYIVVGVSGLAAFGSDVTDNIVRNFIMDGSSSTDAILCCISVGITVLGSFSVSLLPAREAILEAFGYDHDHSARLGLGITLAVSALVLGIISPGLVTICSVVGGAIGTWISYIFPVYLTYCHGELLNPSSPYFGWKHVFMCSLVMVCGAGAGTLGSVMSVIHALTKPQV